MKNYSITEVLSRMINIFMIGCGVLLLFVAPSQAHDNTFESVEYVRNYDGDTITVNIPNLPPIFGKNISIRVNGIDTPEIRGSKCPQEKALAIQARQFVRKQILTSRTFELVNVKRGKYFRVVADVYLDGKNLTTMLLDNGLGYSYHGGTKDKLAFCK